MGHSQLLIQELSSKETIETIRNNSIRQRTITL